MHAKLKRLTATGLVIEQAPGLFAIPRPKPGSRPATSNLIHPPRTKRINAQPALSRQPRLGRQRTAWTADWTVVMAAS